MSVNPSPIGGYAWQFFDNNGHPLSGGKVYTYAAGTTTPQATYTSALGTTPHANPIVLDSAGRVPGGEIWLTDGLSYKFTLETSSSILIGTYDNVEGINPTLNADLIDYDPPFLGALTSGYTVENKLEQYVSVKDFGAVGDGVTDDTAAFQAAIDNGKPFIVPFADYLWTDSLQIDPLVGVEMICEARTVANNAAFPRITFQPTTKRDVFVWTSLPASYSFAGVRVTGFSLVGAGPGAAAVFNLPRLYRGNIEAYIYTGVDHFAVVERWLDCNVTGNINGFRVSAFRITNSTLLGNNITTRTNFDVYISGGDPAYTTYGYDIETFAITSGQITNMIESVDCAVRMARGNTLDSTIYTENVPRSNAGALLEIGKIDTGTPDGTTIFNHWGTNLHGRNSAASGYTNTLFADIDYCSSASFNGTDIKRFGALIATTANSKNIKFDTVYTVGVGFLEFSGTGIADFAQLTFNAFRPIAMYGNSVEFLTDNVPTTTALNPNGSRYPRWAYDRIYSSSSRSFWVSIGDGLNDWRLDAPQVYTGSASVSAGTIAAGASYSATITVTGALSGDFAVASYGATYADITVSARVTGPDTVTVVLTNISASPIATITATVRVMVTKVMV